MRKLGKYDSPQLNSGKFLLKGIIYYFLGASAGLKGKAPVVCAFLGPLAEKFTNIDFLESFVQGVEREKWQIIRAEEASRIAEKLVNSLTLPDTFSLNSDPLLLKPPEFDEPDIRWLDLIVPPKIVLLLGGRGSGKTALGFRLLEIFRYKLMPYIIGLPSQCAHLLPDWIGTKESLHDVPSGSISLVDEAYLSNHARDWAKAESRDLCELLNLSRQQGKTIIFVAPQSRQLNLDIVSSADVIVLKNPSLAQGEFERPALRQMVSNAKLAFKTISGDRKKWSYVNSTDTDSASLVENTLPTFWSQKLSRIYEQGTINEKADEKHPSKMTLGQNKEKAKELNQAGWSLGKLANYFGVSKSTIFNWIHDYPYPKKRKLP